MMQRVVFERAAWRAVRAVPCLKGGKEELTFRQLKVLQQHQRLNHISHITVHKGKRMYELDHPVKCHGRDAALTPTNGPASIPHLNAHHPQSHFQGSVRF